MTDIEWLDVVLPMLDSIDIHNSPKASVVVYNAIAEALTKETISGTIKWRLAGKNEGGSNSYESTIMSTSISVAKNAGIWHCRVSRCRTVNPDATKRLIRAIEDALKFSGRKLDEMVEFEVPLDGMKTLSPTRPFNDNPRPGRLFKTPN